MAPDNPPLVTKAVLDECPRFRVLVVGKTGVGKSSLIRYAFGIENNLSSLRKHGDCDIEEEIMSEQNTRFVLHDSLGFDTGDLKNFNAAKEFLKSRTGKGVALKDRVHAIWLCLLIPHAGLRVFETGDDLFLSLAASLNVPAIVVFTQFDKLIKRMFVDLTPAERQKARAEVDVQCVAKAHVEYEKMCVAPLKRMNPKTRYARTSGLSGKASVSPDRQALAILIDITQRLVRDAAGTTEDMVPIVSAMAQRVSSHGKIEGSVEVGMKRYWKGLASSSNFLGLQFEHCLDTIHEEITDSWNFNDPNELLNGPDFKKKIQTLVQLVTPDATEAKSWFANIDERVQLLAGFGTFFAAAAVGPAVTAIGLSSLFIQWIAQAYDKTPETLRCFMGYIVDLTLVMDHLFLVVLSKNHPEPLSEEDINKAVEQYKQQNMAKVHRDIRQYANAAAFHDIVQSNRAELKVTDLIEKYCNRPNNTV